MAFWNPGQITGVNDGIVADDGTGDPIRLAFIKVNENFSNISTFLAQPTLDFLYANITDITSEYITSDNIFTPNIRGVNGNFSGNITADNFNANIGIHNLGVTTLQGNSVINNVTFVSDTEFVGNNIKIGTNIIPTANLQYDLGSPDAFYRNIYTKGLVQVNTVSLNADASILQLQPNVIPGSVKDVGILGKYNITDSNTYAYFGFQYETKDFIYYTTPVNSATGNSIIVGGVYGNVHFGSGLLSNTTPSTDTSTGALVVAGGVGIGGNLNVASNINVPTTNGNIIGTYANLSYINVNWTGGGAANVLTINSNVSANVIYSQGFQVLTTNTPGLTYYTNVPIFTTNVVITSSTPSNSTGTGALVLSYGGLGVAGNINSGGNVTASGLVGPMYGTIQTAAQPNITSLGTITNLNANAISATSLGVGSATITSTLNFAVGAGISGLAILNVSGNIYAGNVIATKGEFNNVQGTLITAAQPNVTSLGVLPTLNATVIAAANISVGNITANGNLSLASATITSLGGITMTGNITAGSVMSTFYGTHVGNNIGNLTGNVTGNVVTAAQPYITSLGTLTGLTVTGNINGNVDGNVLKANQPNITSLGTLSSLTATGNITTSGLIYSTGTTGIPATVNVNAFLTGGYGGATTGKLIIGDGTGKQFNIARRTGSTTTDEFTFFDNGNVSVAGNVVADYVIANTSVKAASMTVTGAYSGAGTGLTGNAASLSIGGTAPAINLSGTTLATGVTISSLTSVGNITSGTWSGTVVNSNYGGSGVDNNGFTLSWNANYSLNQSVATTASPTFAGLTTGNIIPSANVTYNLGSTTRWWDNVYGVAVQAQYADLAERYTADAEYEPGTVVVFGGNEEITVTDQYGDTRVAGAISTDPAYLMNAAAPGLPVALRGRVPCKVEGPVTKGDGLITSTTPGYATSIGTNSGYGRAVFAKALETNLEVGHKIITVVIL